MMLRKGRKDDFVCSICGALTWVEDENPSDVGLSTKTKQKKKEKALKEVLCWFPLKPRLHRVFYVY